LGLKLPQEIILKLPQAYVKIHKL